MLIVLSLVLRDVTSWRDWACSGGPSRPKNWPRISWRSVGVVSYAGFRCTAFNKSPSAASICICLAAQWRRVRTNMNFNPRQPRRGGARMREQLHGFNKYFASPAERRRRTPLSSYAPDPVKIFTQQLRKYLLRGNRSPRQPNGTAITLALNPRR